MPCFNKAITQNSFYYKHKYESASFVYAGAVIKWQCLDETIHLFSLLKEKLKNATLTILSSDQQEVIPILKKYNINAIIKYVPLEELDEELAKYKYGFILRKDLKMNHGPDYERKKWGKLAKVVINFGERVGIKYANQVIVISDVINNIIKAKYKYSKANLIYNGVNIPIKSKKTDYLEKLGLESGKYIFTLGRFVEEKGFDGLINAFLKTKLVDYKLVIAGAADHNDEYSSKLKHLAYANNIILTGFIKGEKLNQLFTNARLFVLPSFHVLQKQELMLLV